MTLTIDQLTKLDAEGFAESIIADYLEWVIDRDIIPLNGSIRRGLADEGQVPDRPRLLVSVVKEDSKMEHPRYVSLALLVSLQTYSLGDGPTEETQASHAGVSGETAAQWRQHVRDCLGDMELWADYFALVRAVLGVVVPRWVPRGCHITGGAIDDNPDTQERDLDTTIRFVLVSS